MPDDVGGSPFPDGDEPEFHRGGADDEFASVVLDEDFVRSAAIHEPTAVERILAAAQSHAESVENAENAENAENGAARSDDGYGYGPGAEGELGPADLDEPDDPDDPDDDEGRFDRSDYLKYADDADLAELDDAEDDEHGLGLYGGAYGVGHGSRGLGGDAPAYGPFGPFGPGDYGACGPYGPNPPYVPRGRSRFAPPHSPSPPPWDLGEEHGSDYGFSDYGRTAGGDAPAGARPRAYRGHARWQRPVAWVLAVVMGIGMVALALSAVYRGASAQRQEPAPPPASTGVGSSRSEAGDRQHRDAYDDRDASAVADTAAAGPAEATAAPHRG